MSLSFLVTVAQELLRTSETLHAYPSCDHPSLLVFLVVRVNAVFRSVYYLVRKLFC